MNQYMTCAQRSTARWLQVPEERQEKAADRIGDEDVSPPQPEGMHDADEEESRHPAGVESHALMARGGAIHLDREANPEERREDRDELALDEPVDERLRESVGKPRPHQRRLHVGRHRRVEPAHVGGDDAEERRAAQAVDDGDAFAAGDGPDRFGRDRVRGRRRRKRAVVAGRTAGVPCGWVLSPSQSAFAVTFGSRP